MDYFEMIGQNVRKVLDAVEREGMPCEVPSDMTGSRAELFKAEFAKKSEEIDKQAREAIGVLIVGALSDLHAIAQALQPQKRTLLENAAGA